MTTTTAVEHKVDRTGWPLGPWDQEPDRVEWRTAAGLPALILRHFWTGNLCGYVAVPPGHPLHGQPYGAAGDALPKGAHGGLTYAGACRGSICHVPAEGEPDDVHWLGFDCAHAFDAQPGRLDRMWIEPDMRYRTVDYVRAECESLAAQLVEVQP